MQFKALVIAYEDSSYTGKRGQVAQETLTCLDADDVKMKDTVDVVFPMGLIPGAPQSVGKTLTFQIEGIRPSQNMRLKFVCKGVVKAAS